MSITALLLAGGASSRMGTRDKLLEDVGGTPLLRERALACLASCADRVRVVLPPDRPERAKVLTGLDVDIIYNDGADVGMSNSLRCGVAGLEAGAVLIVLADLPDLTTPDLDKVMRAADAHPLATILRGADATGKPGHPVLLRQKLYADVMTLSGDTGAQPLLRQYKADTVLVPIGAAALRDLDTPEDWAAWRADRS
ncbi:nucleotidyltransferase family protein [Litoreibacter albidus]|uniref:CTP:molybdopterin cytidylyltransferase MocA n=1 Tax=Litoreibacter albidus TaxID=670155 RepID=A0A1H2TL99_9RHOB|nr:nucleotidyltransferase family protein [Litoreibacter albidus]SDW44681.1 CTP:molybdopterin cytidylyltransferase MocA [Litoreibacter albidus]